MGGEGCDDEDFDDFVAARSAGLMRIAFLLTGDHGHAEDLVQVTLTKVYASWSRIRRRQVVDAYARTVLTRTATSWWRRRRHQERPTESLPERSGVDESTSSLENRDLLDRALQQLPARQRAVLVLRFYEDLSIEQAAEILGCSAGAVKSHSSRALATLRRIVPAQIIQEDRR